MGPVYDKKAITQARSTKGDCFNCCKNHIFLWIEIESIGWRGCCSNCGVLFDGLGRILHGTKRYRASEGTKRTIRKLYKAFVDGKNPVAYVHSGEVEDE